MAFFFNLVSAQGALAATSSEDGVCGSAYMKSLSATPELASDLCESGDASEVVIESGMFAWTCKGTLNTAPCWATVSANANSNSNVNSNANKNKNKNKNVNSNTNVNSNANANTNSNGNANNNCSDSNPQNCQQQPSDTKPSAKSNSRCVFGSGDGCEDQSGQQGRQYSDQGQYVIYGSCGGSPGTCNSGYAINVVSYNNIVTWSCVGSGGLAVPCTYISAGSSDTGVASISDRYPTNTNASVAAGTTTPTDTTSVATGTTTPTVTAAVATGTTTPTAAVATGTTTPTTTQAATTASSSTTAKCGSANGGTFSIYEPPASNERCAVGGETSFLSTGSGWTWKCTASDGSSTTCSATLKNSDVCNGSSPGQCIGEGWTPGPTAMIGTNSGVSWYCYNDAGTSEDKYCTYYYSSSDTNCGTSSSQQIKVEIMEHFKLLKTPIGATSNGINIYDIGKNSLDPHPGYYYAAYAPNNNYATSSSSTVSGNSYALPACDSSGKYFCYSDHYMTIGTTLGLFISDTMKKTDVVPVFATFGSEGQLGASSSAKTAMDLQGTEGVLMVFGPGLAVESGRQTCDKYEQWAQALVVNLEEWNKSVSAKEVETTTNNDEEGNAKEAYPTGGSYYIRDKNGNLIGEKEVSEAPSTQADKDLIAEQYKNDAAVYSEIAEEAEARDAAAAATANHVGSNAVQQQSASVYLAPDGAQMTQDQIDALDSASKGSTSDKIQYLNSLKPTPTSPTDGIDPMTYDLGAAATAPMTFPQ